MHKLALRFLPRVVPRIVGRVPPPEALEWTSAGRWAPL